MAISRKNFRVVRGVEIGNNLDVGGYLSVSTPINDNHAANKSYIDSLNLITVDSAAPVSPVSGMLWLDTLSEKLHLFNGSSWIPMATLADAQNLPQHIHDTSIDGDGRIISSFIDGGSAYATAYYTVSAGTPGTTSWDEEWSGGIATNNFS